MVQLIMLLIVSCTYNVKLVLLGASFPLSLCFTTTLTCFWDLPILLIAIHVYMPSSSIVTYGTTNWWKVTSPSWVGMVGCKKKFLKFFFAYKQFYDKYMMWFLTTYHKFCCVVLRVVPPKKLRTCCPSSFPKLNKFSVSPIFESSFPLKVVIIGTDGTR